MGILQRENNNLAYMVKKERMKEKQQKIKKKRRMDSKEKRKE